MLKRAEKPYKEQINIKKKATNQKSKYKIQKDDFFRNSNVPIIWLRIYIWFAIFVFLFSFLWLINFDSNDVSRTIDIIDRLLFFWIMILVIIWTYKRYKHLQTSNLQWFWHSPWWAIRWWIIPIASWIIPFNIMRELYKWNFAIKNKSTDWKSIELPKEIMWRQILWIICSILINTIPEDTWAIILLPIIWFLVSCYLLISVIRKIDKTNY